MNQGTGCRSCQTAPVDLVGPIPAWRLWIAGGRPRTLPAAVVPVAVGTAAAVGVDGSRGIVAWRFVAAMVVALAIQVATNYANDYSDGVRGTDDETRVGPVRLVGSGLAAPASVKRAAIVSFGVAGCAGLALAAATTWWLVVVGAVSFAAGWLYTGGPKPYGYHGLGEVFVFVFFGLVATVGSTYVQIERITWLSVLCAVPVGALATALLVINNLRDIPTDTVAGKRTLAVRLGDRGTRRLYVGLMVLPYPLLVVLGVARPAVLVAALTIASAWPPVTSVIAGARGRELIDVLGGTGRTQLVFGVLLSVGLAISG